MSGTYFFNKAFILDRVRMGLEDALDDVGERVAADARRRAPIRKVFKEKPGFRRKFRALTDAERAQAIDRANAYYGARGQEFKRRRAVAHIRFYAKVQVPRRGSMNSVGNSMGLRQLGIEKGGKFTSASGASRLGRGFEPGPEQGAAMTAQGKYEVRSGRAVHREASEMGTHTRVQIGGALKASIGSEGVTETDSGVKVRVTAGIRYAKFVEFPTIRTSAQPFLLPALHGARARLPRDVATAIKKSIGG